MMHPVHLAHLRARNTTAHRERRIAPPPSGSYLRLIFLMP